MNFRNWGGKREGSGRKPTGSNTESITLTLTKGEAAELKYRAELRKQTISKYVADNLVLNVRFRPPAPDDKYDISGSATGGRRCCE